VEHELFTLPVFSGVRVARYLVFYIVLCKSLFVLCPFSFGHGVACHSIYGLCLVIKREKSLPIPMGESSVVNRRRTDKRANHNP
jgi:hypothetical protein